jgi:putative transposase
VGQRPHSVTNHLALDFHSSRQNEKWVTDTTYIHTGEGWLYLAIVVDLHSNVVVGWSMAPRQDRSLVTHAVLIAYFGPSRALISAS